VHTRTPHLARRRAVRDGPPVPRDGRAPSLAGADGGGRAGHAEARLVPAASVAAAAGARRDRHGRVRPHGAPAGLLLRKPAVDGRRGGVRLGRAPARRPARGARDAALSARCHAPAGGRGGRCGAARVRLGAPPGDRRSRAVLRVPLPHLGPVPGEWLRLVRAARHPVRGRRRPHGGRQHLQRARVERPEPLRGNGAAAGAGRLRLPGGRGRAGRLRHPLLRAPPHPPRGLLRRNAAPGPLHVRQRLRGGWRRVVGLRGGAGRVRPGRLAIPHPARRSQPRRCGRL
ncbi:MAG: hypothetical protein AVDCRST_MAG68-585, partial [uncultured Gemmatimonadetes bacterium]